MKMKKDFIKTVRHDTEFEGRIGRVVKEFSNNQETISVAEIESWVAKDNLKKRAKKRRLMSVAASFIMIVGIGLSCGYFMTVNEPIAVAGGGDTKVSTEENVGGNEYVRTDWDEAMKLAEEYPDMLIPGYIPEGYEFKELKVTKTGAGKIFEFWFANNNGKELIIKEVTGISDAVMTDYDEEIHCENGVIYLNHEEGKNVGVRVVKKTRISIISEMPEENLIRVMDQLKNGS